MPSKGEAGGSKEVIEDGDKEGEDERGGQAAAVHADIEAEDVGEGGGGEQAREREIWLDGENGLKVKEGSRDWKSPWRYLTGYGWRTDIPLLLLMHLERRIFIELSPDEATGFVYKVGIEGNTPQNTPGNTPRLPNKIKRCNADGYLCDWRFNGSELVRDMVTTGGKPMHSFMRYGAWQFGEREPIESAKEVFDSFDTDGGGSMDAAELKEAAKVMGFVLDDSKPIPEDGIEFDEFLKILDIPAEPERCMLVNPISEEVSDMEIWLTQSGFVFLSASNRDEALIDKYPDFTVPKQEGHQALPRADQSYKQAQHWRHLEWKAAEAIRLQEVARQEAEDAVRAKEIAEEAKRERRRRREAGLDDPFAAQ